MNARDIENQRMIEELHIMANDFESLSHGGSVVAAESAALLRSAIAEIERLRAINHDYERGMEITAEILATLGRDPLPTLAGRLNQIVVLVEFRKTNPT